MSPLISTPHTIYFVNPHLPQFILVILHTMYNKEWETLYHVILKNQINSWPRYGSVVRGWGGCRFPTWPLIIMWLKSFCCCCCCLFHFPFHPLFPKLDKVAVLCIFFAFIFMIKVANIRILCIDVKELQWHKLLECLSLFNGDFNEA